MSLKGFFSLILIAMNLSVSAACSKEKEEEEEKAYAIPAVSASCSAPATKCADNSANGGGFIVYWSNTICAESNSSTQIKAGGEAPAVCAEGTCTATISAWTTFDGAAVSELLEGSYYLCAGIDLDDNNELNQAGEPVAVKEAVKIEEDAAAQTVGDFVDQE